MNLIGEAPRPFPPWLALLAIVVGMATIGFGLGYSAAAERIYEVCLTQLGPDFERGCYDLVQGAYSERVAWHVIGARP